LAKAHALRRADLEAKRQQLAERHSAERKALSDLQNARNEDIARDRAVKQPKGVLSFLARITGFNALTGFRQSLQDRKRDQEYSLQSAALARRHSREMENFKHQERGLDSLDKRERRSLETGLRRDVFRAIAAPAKTRPVASELTAEQRAKAEKSKQMAEQFRKASATLRHSPEQLRAAEQRAQEARSAATGINERVAAFKRTAAEISAPAAEQTDAAAGITKKQPDALKPTFNETAGGSAAPPPRSLWETFNEKAEKAGDPRLREIKENAMDITEKARKAIDLAREFRERAGPPAPPKDHERDGGEKHYRRPPPDYSMRR
jgi:hypothetical protein